MRTDGTAQRQITQDQRYTHTNPAWDAWGRALVFQQSLINTAHPSPEVAVWEAATGKIQVLATDAALPAWLP
jgi:hypothetical protein